MGVPKRKVSHQRQGKRRGKQKINPPAVAECPHCGQPKLPQFICPSCGSDGKKEEKKEKQTG